MASTPVLLPSTLAAFTLLREALDAVGSVVFADWEFDRASDVAIFYPELEAVLATEASHDLVPFAGDGGGGVLVLDTDAVSLASQAVIAFSSEGSITVLGESLDDFLAVITSTDSVVEHHGWAADAALRARLVAVGVVPHTAARTHLAKLALRTRAFHAKWAQRMHDASKRLRPEVVVDHALVLGESIAGVRLGAPRSALDARWGTPSIPDWGVRDGRMYASYEGSPLTIHLDAKSHEVVRVGVNESGAHHRFVTSDGVAPMRMMRSEAIAWLASLGHVATVDGDAIHVPSAKMTLTVRTSQGGALAEPWVTGIDLHA